MDEVAAAVGVTKPLLYNYFGNKERLYLRLHGARRRRAAERRRRRPSRARRTAPRRCARGIHAFFAFLDADRDAWRVLFDETLPAGGEIAAARGRVPRRG